MKHAPALDYAFKRSSFAEFDTDRMLELLFAFIETLLTYAESDPVRWIGCSSIDSFAAALNRAGIPLSRQVSPDELGRLYDAIMDDVSKRGLAPGNRESATPTREKSWRLWRDREANRKAFVHGQKLINAFIERSQAAKKGIFLPLLGKYLRRLRLRYKNNLTQLMLAEEIRHGVRERRWKFTLPVSDENLESYVRKIETGRIANPPPSVLFAIADICEDKYGVVVRYLANEKYQAELYCKYDSDKQPDADVLARHGERSWSKYRNKIYLPKTGEYIKRIRQWTGRTQAEALRIVNCECEGFGAPYGFPEQYLAKLETGRIMDPDPIFLCLFALVAGLDYKKIVAVLVEEQYGVTVTNVSRKSVYHHRNIFNLVDLCG